MLRVHIFIGDDRDRVTELNRHTSHRKLCHRKVYTMGSMVIIESFSAKNEY